MLVSKRQNIIWFEGDLFDHSSDGESGDAFLNLNFNSIFRSNLSWAIQVATYRIREFNLYQLFFGEMSALIDLLQTVC